MYTRVTIVGGMIESYVQSYVLLLTQDQLRYDDDRTNYLALQWPIKAGFFYKPGKPFPRNSLETVK